MFEVIKQLVDFLIKAVIAYVQTPQGEKEFHDIEVAIEALQGRAPEQAPAPQETVATKARGRRIVGGK